MKLTKSICVCISGDAIQHRKRGQHPLTQSQLTPSHQTILTGVDFEFIVQLSRDFFLPIFWNDLFNTDVSECAKQFKLLPFQLTTERQHPTLVYLRMKLL